MICPFPLKIVVWILVQSYDILIVLKKFVEIFMVEIMLKVDHPTIQQPDYLCTHHHLNTFGKSDVNIYVNIYVGFQILSKNLMYYVYSKMLFNIVNT